MPFINTKYTGEINEQQEHELKSAFAKAAANIGKSESWLMLGFEPNSSIYFRGEKPQKAAFVDVSLYGKAEPSAYDAMTADICAALNKTLGVPADMVYVKYSPTDNWGWNGGNF